MGDNESFGESSLELMEQALDAVSAFVHSLPTCRGDMVQRFVLLVETIDENDRWLSAFTAPGQKAWDTLGLLEYGRMMEHSYHQAMLDGDENDEP